MGSTLVTSQFKSFWRKAIENPSAMVNPTIVRKYLTTKVHRDHQELKHDVAGHLNHSAWIAEEYDLVDRRKQAASISGRIQSIQRDDDSNERYIKEKDLLENIYHEEIVSGDINTEKINSKIGLFRQKFDFTDTERENVFWI